MKLQTDRIDTDLLPGLRDLLPGEQLIEKARPVLAAIFKSLADPGVRHDANRKLKIQLAFVPEAAHDSSQVKLQRLEAALPGPRPPKTSRIVFDDSDGDLRVIPRGDFSPEAATGDPPVSVTDLPALDELFGDALDESFRWELAKVVLNLKDPRTESNAVRALDLEIVFTASEDREVCRYQVTKCVAKIAGAKKPEAAALYLERNGDELAVHHEAAAVLPSEDGPVTGRQSNVLDMRS